MNKHNEEVIETTLLRGRVKLLQPKVGFHASVDSVFLAAAAPVRDRFHVLDVGCGVGSVGLCIYARNQNIHLTGIDFQDDLVDLARQNAQLNGLGARGRFFHGDISTEKYIEDNGFNLAVMNPPYLASGAHTASPERIKAASHGDGGVTLGGWVKYAHRKLKAGGNLALIHRADRLDDAINALTQRKWFGSLVILPLYSHEGEPAKRVIIRARKERYAPLVLRSGLIVHKENGKYTREADALLSGAAGIP